MFDDDGHYTDIHVDITGGTARIPTSSRPFVDEPDSYDSVHLNQPTTSDDNAME